MKDNAFLEIEKEIMCLIKERASLKSSLERQREEDVLAQKKMLISMIELADDFERLLAIIEPKLDSADKTAKKWVKSFKSIYKSLGRKLAKFSVTKMNIIIGDEAHPVYHRILGVEETNQYKDNAILCCKTSGYIWGKDVLREADVITAKNESQ